MSHSILKKKLKQLLFQSVKPNYHEIIIILTDHTFLFPLQLLLSLQCGFCSTNTPSVQMTLPKSQTMIVS